MKPIDIARHVFAYALMVAFIVTIGFVAYMAITDAGIWWTCQNQIQEGFFNRCSVNGKVLDSFHGEYVNGTLTCSYKCREPQTINVVEVTK